MRHVVPMACGLGLLVAAAIAVNALVPPQEDASTYHVERIPRLPPGAEDLLVRLNGTVMAAFPPAVRDAFIAAAREGNASFAMSTSERDRLYATLRDAARLQGREGIGYYEWDEALLQMGSRIP